MGENLNETKDVMGFFQNCKALAFLEFSGDFEIEVEDKCANFEAEDEIVDESFRVFTGRQKL